MPTSAKTQQPVKIAASVTINTRSFQLALTSGQLKMRLRSMKTHSGIGHELIASLNGYNV